MTKGTAAGRCFEISRCWKNFEGLGTEAHRSGSVSENPTPSYMPSRGQIGVR